jgi:hypothetical protein
MTEDDPTVAAVVTRHLFVTAVASRVTTSPTTD